MTNAFLLAGAACVAMVAAPAVAAPVVTVDIAPVHSLAAQVMQGVGAPTLIVQPGASPHGYSMRPSEAAALQASDVVIWVGAGLTPWLERSIETVAADATSLALLTVPGVTTLGFREGATFEAHHDDHGGEGHAHDNHADDAYRRDHEGVDPHAWLDPENARLWLDAIAGALSAADPANATTYFRNAAAEKAALDALSAEIVADLAPLAGRGFVVFHDAYHDFEARFGVEAAGAIAIGDAATPGPARVSGIKGAIEAMNAVCVFSEPQVEPALVETVIEGTDARTGELDPLGADLAPGPDLYPTLLRNLRDSLVACLGA